jgi:hypothetical protein
MNTKLNLAHAMIAENRKALVRENAVIIHQQNLDREVEKLLAEVREDSQKAELLSTLGMDYKLAEAKQVEERRNKWAHLPQERIFTRDAIRAVCVRYGLRFLPSSLYKGALDEGIAAAVEDLKAKNGGRLPTAIRFRGDGFFIAAPKESFALQARPVDPLLFCDLGDGQYYLVHKWGTDLSAFRRLAVLWKRHRWTVTVPTAIALPTAAFAYLGFAGASFLATMFLWATALVVPGIMCGWDESLDQRLEWFLGKNDARNWDSPYHS